MEQDIRSRFMNRNNVPLSLVAFIEDGSRIEQLCGTASMDERDLSIRPNLGPWLVNVYVPPEHRKKGTLCLDRCLLWHTLTLTLSCFVHVNTNLCLFAGVARVLLDEISARARSMGIKQLYLWTSDDSVVTMYKARGWVILEETPYLNETIKIMQLQLGIASKL